MRRIAAALTILAGLLPYSALAQAPLRSHALSLIGPAQLPPGFAHFPYANPDAPKGGEVALGAVGSFDSFSPHIVRGSSAAATGAIYDTLMRSSADEPHKTPTTLGSSAAYRPVSGGIPASVA